jgi:NADPH2:quinone reductase
VKAAIYHEPGGPDVLRYESVPDPAQPAAGEILIRVEAISIEGGDLLARQRIAPGSPPKSGGYAAAGEVIALGPNVNHFDLGQKVATFAFGGSHAEFRVAPAATSWAIPSGLDVKLAAAVPCGPGTAALALELGGLKPGQTVLIQGAAGGVGVAAVQLARRTKARVLGTGSNSASLERLRDYGLSDAIIAGERSVNDQVRELLGGEGVDLLIDNVGGPALMAGLAAVKDGGRAVLVGVLGGMDYSIDAFHLLGHRQTVTGCFLGPMMAEPFVHQMIGSLLEQVARGELTVPIDAVYPLSEASAAHARAEQRGRLGRVVMIP